MREMTGKERAGRVESLVSAYARDFEPDGEDTVTAVIDMIADLCHFVAALDAAPQVIVEIALGHYNEESAPQDPLVRESEQAFWTAVENDFFDNQEEM